MFEYVRTYLIEKAYKKKTFISIWPNMFEIVEQEARTETCPHPVLKNCVHDVWYTLPVQQIILEDKDDIEIATALSNYSITMDAAYALFLKLYEKLTGKQINAKPCPREFFGTYEGAYLNFEVPYNNYHRMCSGIEISEDCVASFSPVLLDLWCWGEQTCLLSQIAKEEIPSPIAGKLLRKMLPKLVEKK